MAHILVVEDEHDIAQLISVRLTREGYTVSICENGLDALTQIKQQKFDLVVLDWMLPGLSGLEVCKKIHGQLPILMVTARSDAADIVLGLESGAEDYITKPFDTAVFIARVRTLLRRKQLSLQTSIFQIDNLRIDVDRHEASVDHQSLNLTTSEFKLLLAMMKNAGRVLSRERLIESVQGDAVSVTDRTIDTHISGLRKKLGSAQDVVETIRGIGYRVKG